MGEKPGAGGGDDDQDVLDGSQPYEMNRAKECLFGRVTYVAETPHAGPDSVVWQLPPASLVHHGSLVRDASKEVYSCRNQSAVGSCQKSSWKSPR